MRYASYVSVSVFVVYLASGIAFTVLVGTNLTTVYSSLFPTLVAWYFFSIFPGLLWPMVCYSLELQVRLLQDKIVRLNRAMDAVTLQSEVALIQRCHQLVVTATRKTYSVTRWGLILGLFFVVSLIDMAWLGFYTQYSNHYQLILVLGMSWVFHLFPLLIPAARVSKINGETLGIANNVFVHIESHSRKYLRHMVIYFQAQDNGIDVLGIKITTSLLGQISFLILTVFGVIDRVIEKEYIIL